MSRRPAITTQADIARAVRAAKQAGAGSVVVKPNGEIVINITATPAENSPIVPVDDDRGVAL